MPSSLENLKAALAGRYQIEREIGQGGMATVYLANDLRHERKVAVKVLRPDLAAALGPERFLREIKIAANLTHPHILPLHDSGEADGFLYYVMPYIKGDTLRERIEKEVELPVAEAVRIIREVTDALAFAHSQGVVHRDIKPDNVMLSGRHAMVMDFGVAKAVSEATGRTTLTTAGVALGTPTYMAPEQATADPHVDHRADIYAVGVMAYELLAGRTPFQGASPQAVLAAHVTEEAEPVSKHRDHVSGDLEALVMKCLAKKPADRWQSADEMLPHLEAMAATSGGLTPTSTRPIEGVGVAAPRRRVWWMAAGAAAALIVIAVFGATMLRDDPLIITTSNILQVTSEPGLEFQPSLSPDGKDVAYVVGPIGTPRVVIRSTINLSSGGETRLGEGLPGSHWLPMWTADGASIRFVVCDHSGSKCEWREAGKLGGTSTPISVPSTRGNTHGWSPDGTRVAFSRSDSIFAYSTEDTEPQLLGIHTVDTWNPHSFAWSPGGQLLAYVNGNPQWRFSGNLSGSSIWIIDANGGEPVAVTSPDHMNLSPQWLPDSRHIVFVSNRDGPRGIYVVEVGLDGPLGDVQSVATSTDPHSISVSTDGKKLAFSKFHLRQNIWSIPIPRSEVLSIRDAQPVTTGNQVIESHDLSPDGRFVTFDGSRLGNADIYRMPVEGGNAQLIADLPGSAFAPVWSPDGTEIAFFGGLGATNHAIFVVSANGGDPRLIVDFPFGDLDPSWSPDGLTIAFLSRGSQQNDPYAVWTVSRESVGDAWGDPVRLTDFFCDWSDWTPDGESLVCSTGSEFVIVSKSGAVVSRFAPQMQGGLMAPLFSSDGSAIYFFGRPTDEWGIWSMPVAGGEPTRLVAFDDPSLTLLTGPAVRSLSVGPDRFYLTISEYESDIWVMDLEY